MGTHDRYVQEKVKEKKGDHMAAENTEQQHKGTTQDKNGQHQSSVVRFA